MGEKDLTLVIGNYNYSSWSFRAWLCLDGFGLSFTTIRIALSRPDTKQKILAYNKAGKVPVLQLDGVRVWDSLAICETVSEQLLDGRGWPGNDLLRALGRSVVAEMHSGFTALRQGLPMNVRRRYENMRWSPEVQADIERIQDLFIDCLELSRGPYLLGEFSIADCFYAPVVSRFATYGVPLPGEIGRYCKRVLSHPSVVKWYGLAAEESEVIEEEELAPPEPGADAAGPGT